MIDKRILLIFYVITSVKIYLNERDAVKKTEEFKIRYIASL